MQNKLNITIDTIDYVTRIGNIEHRYYRTNGPSGGYSSAHSPQLHFQRLFMVANSARVEVESQTVFF